MKQKKLNSDHCVSFRSVLKNVFKGIPIIWIGLISECVLFSLLIPSFPTANNFLTVARQASINSIIAFSMTLVIISGGIDLSVGSIVALSGVTTALSLRSGFSLITAVLFGLGVGVIAGLINGIVISGTRIPPFIVTLGMMTMARGVAGQLTGGYPVSISNSHFLVIGTEYFCGIPIPIIIMMTVSVILHIILSRTKFGLHVYALGGNETAAYLCGIKVKSVKIKVYVISGLCAALSGMILASRLFSGQPSVGVGFELDAITAAILGGTSFAGGVGNLIGTIFGAFTVAILLNGLALLNVSYYWQLIIRGIVIMFALLFLDKDK